MNGGGARGGGGIHPVREGGGRVGHERSERGGGNSHAPAIAKLT